MKQFENREIVNLLDKKSHMRPLLFPRGFILTDDTSIDSARYPFYDEWNSTDIFGYKFLVHPKQKVYTVLEENLCFALVGHAFNPLSSEEEIAETLLLRKSLKLYKESEPKFTEYFNQLTGLFALFVFDKDRVRIYGDTAGMYTIFYGTHDGKNYCASHTGLLADVCGLEFDPYINHLVNYRFYHLFGKALPGDLSPYREFKRLIPNHFAEYVNGQWEVTRFFPLGNDALYDLPYEDIIDRSAQILSRTMHLIHKKWNRAAISLTGGCDSKTTLACTNGAYEKYSYFSYSSSSNELVDAEAAQNICKLLKIPHNLYTISDNDSDYDDIESMRTIMEYNCGMIGKNNANDVRKRAFFLGVDDFDVEVKSWASEIARAYYHKRFNKKSFPKKLTPRYATCLYKVFLTDCKLMKETDLVFADYLKKYYSDGSFDKIAWYDLFFWEYRMSSWNGLVITGEQHISYDICIPYNNRELLRLLLSTPVEKRLKDEPHWAIMKKMNAAVSDCGISVVNVKHTNKRAKMEKLYLNIRSKLPF